MNIAHSLVVGEYIEVQVPPAIDATQKSQNFDLPCGVVLDAELNRWTNPPQFHR